MWPLYRYIQSMCVSVFKLNDLVQYVLEVLEDSLPSYSALNGGFVKACLKVACLL